MVRPFNIDSLKKMIFEEIEDFIQPGVEICLLTEALVNNSQIITDCECIYSFMDKKIGTLRGATHFDYYYDIGVRLKKNNVTNNSYSMSMFNDFEYPISLTELQEHYFLPEVTLRRFMDERYNYNPRIRTNMHRLITEINGN